MSSIPPGERLTLFVETRFTWIWKIFKTKGLSHSRSQLWPRWDGHGKNALTSSETLNQTNPLRRIHSFMGNEYSAIARGWHCPEVIASSSQVSIAIGQMFGHKFLLKKQPVDRCCGKSIAYSDPLPAIVPTTRVIFQMQSFWSDRRSQI